MDILIVNSAGRVDAGRWVADCLSGVDCRLRVVGREALVGGFDASGYERICLSGSERSVFEEADWISAELDFIQKYAAAGKPIMGICFGHQMLARAFYGKDALARRAAPEVGWREVHFNDHWLFDGFSTSIYAFNFHYDEVLVERVPEFEVIACSEQCGVHAIVHRTLPVVGVQFHPEIKPADGTAELEDRAAVLASYNIDAATVISETGSDRKTYLPQVVANFVRYGF